MNDDSVGAYKLSRVQRLHDIIHAFESFFRLNAGKRDIIRRMQRHEHSRAARLVSYFGKRRIGPAYAVTALELVCVKSARADPRRRLDR